MQPIQAKYDEAFNTIADILYDPNLNKAKQVEYNNKRLADVLQAIRYRPYFLPVQISMPPTVATLPKTKATPAVDDNVIISGAITDGENKKVNFRPNKERAPSFVENEGTSNAQISLDAIAGKALESGGLNKIQDFFPFLMREDDSLEVSIYKPVATDTSDVVTICFTGNRVLSQTFVTDYMTADLLELVMREIDKRVSPGNRWASLPVKFEGDGDFKKAEVRTAKSDEPLMILGFRTTFLNAKVNLRFKNEGDFAPEAFPIWALAAEGGNATENYKMLKIPLFIKPQQELIFEFENTIDGAKFAQDGEIEIARQTV